MDFGINSQWLSSCWSVHLSSQLTEWLCVEAGVAVRRKKGKESKIKRSWVREWSQIVFQGRSDYIRSSHLGLATRIASRRAAALRPPVVADADGACEPRRTSSVSTSLSAVHPPSPPRTRRGSHTPAANNITTCDCFTTHGEEVKFASPT